MLSNPLPEPIEAPSGIMATQPKSSNARQWLTSLSQYTYTSKPSWILDPGIGFGKNLKHNMNLIRGVSIFHSLGFPILVGNSRKRFIKDISNKNDSKTRIGGTMASSIYLMMQGIQILRIHDVNEVMQGIKVFNQIIKN